MALVTMMPDSDGRMKERNAHSRANDERKRERNRKRKKVMK